MSAERRVLLLDDDDANRITLGALLEDAGWRVVEASSVREAAQRIAEGTYELAILDVHLRDGRGPELIPELRRRCPRAVLAVLSGSAEDAAGGDLALTKAEDPNALVERIETAVRRRSAP